MAFGHDSDTIWEDEGVLRPWDRKACRTRSPDSSSTGVGEVSKGNIIKVYARDIARSDVRMERVEGVRAAIAKGLYRVSSADLAQSLMSYMLVEHRQAAGAEAAVHFS